MAKKFLSIVLSLLLVFSTFAIVSVAGDTITPEDDFFENLHFYCLLKL